ncbi:unnamed protein product [Rotaria sp. Silwood1]|nr:unnamed protein product [Rotaria sp. Silwood1]
MKYSSFLLFTLLSEANVIERILITTTTTITPLIVDLNINSSFEQILDTNSSLTIILQSQESNISRKEFHYGAQCDANWIFIDKETIRVVFSLFSLATVTHEKKFSNTTDNKINRFPMMLSLTTRTFQSIYSLKFFRFTVQEYKTNTTVLPMKQLILESTASGNDKYFSNSLLLLRLNPKEKYVICIFYYQLNVSTQMPDLFMCLNIMHDHLNDSAHGLIFVLTQYSIILGLLIVLQVLFIVRKRRLAHIVHQHLINTTQRLRSTLSSVSLVRQSMNLMDTIIEQKTTRMNGHVNQEMNKLKKHIIPSSAIVISEPTIESNNIENSSNENEPFLKLTTEKTHVHFLLGLNDESDDNNGGDDDDDDDDKGYEKIPNNKTFIPLIMPTLMEPYDDQSDALSSIAHILDTNKPWSKPS